MAIEDKMSFLRDLEKNISNMVVASDIAKILSAVSDTLQEYDLSLVGDRKNRPDDLFEAYYNAMEIQGKSPKTLSRYKYEVGRLMKFVNTNTRDITVYHIRNYLAHEKQLGLRDATLSCLRSIFSAYFGWLWRESLIEKNPMANIGTIKVPKIEKEIFTDVDVEMLKNGCKRVRDKAIICFLKSSACRISEMTSLNITDVNLESLECLVTGKGNKQRIAYIDEVTALFLKKYLDSRQDDNPALFINQKMERFEPNGVRSMLRTLAKKVGVNHVHPHKFRRTRITEFVKRGMPIEQVKELAGHDKIDTTMGYVVMDKAQVKNAYRKFT